MPLLATSPKVLFAKFLVTVAVELFFLFKLDVVFNKLLVNYNKFFIALWW